VKRIKSVCMLYLIRKSTINRLSSIVIHWYWYINIIKILIWIYIRIIVHFPQSFHVFTKLFYALVKEMYLDSR